MRPARSRRQGGSVIVLMAFISMLLVAFVGVAVDGGEITAQARASQNAADGASLAAAWDIVNNGYSLANATALAQVISQQNGAFSGDLAMSYLDGSGNAAATPSAVASVKASVTHTFATLFLPIINIDSATVTASATVAIQSCVICLINSGAGTDLNVSSTLTVNNGGVIVDGTGAAALVDSGTLTATGISVVGGAQVTGSASPTPTTGAPALADPMAAVPVPSVAGPNNGDYVSRHGQTVTINPGIYSSLETVSGSKVTLSAGTYIVTGAFQIDQGSKVIASNVTIYFACPAYPTACSGGQSGGYLTYRNNPQSTFTAPTSGTYNGIAFFADRNNTATSTFGGTMSVTGSIYMAAGQVALQSGVSLNSRIVASSLTDTGSVTDNFTTAANYPMSAAVTLSQ